MSYTQYQYYEFDCVVLDKPNLIYTDPFLLKVYTNSCLSYDTAFACGVFIKPSKGNVLKIASRSKRAYADDIIGHLKCLAHLLNARIAITETCTLYEDTILNPVIIQPKIDRTCVFYDCYINVIKVQSLLAPDTLLYKNVIISLLWNNTHEENFTNLMRFIKHFKITKFIPTNIEIEQDSTIKCRRYRLFDLIEFFVKYKKHEKITDSFKSVWKMILKRELTDETAPTIYPSLCPLLKYIDDGYIENLRLLRLIDQDTFNRKLAQFVDSTVLTLKQQKIATF